MMRQEPSRLPSLVCGSKTSRLQAVTAPSYAISPWAPRSSGAGRSFVTSTTFHILPSGPQSGWWHELQKQIAGLARTCTHCQTSKVHIHTRAPVQEFEHVREWFSHIHVDIVGPLPVSWGNCYLFTVVDRTTRWPEAILMALPGEFVNAPHNPQWSPHELLPHLRACLDSFKPPPSPRHGTRPSHVPGEQWGPTAAPLQRPYEGPYGV
ncbi:uncharacterized protein [Narcine bancroftii]|uniref:uncharacterized protein n=1 Tax=Narcine bancroftii TaxID=1343680 RepID=UPI00383119DB